MRVHVCVMVIGLALLGSAGTAAADAVSLMRERTSVERQLEQNATEFGARHMDIANGDGCQANCERPRCGDHIVDSGELCDDGNLVSNDGCDQYCHPE